MVGDVCRYWQNVITGFPLYINVTFNRTSMQYPWFRFKYEVITKSLDYANFTSCYFLFSVFRFRPSVGTIPYACNSLTMSTSELVASTIGFEASVVSGSYTVHLDPQPLPLPLPHQDPLVFPLEVGVLMVD